ncbi:MAG: carbamoyl phosphate synthase small subunit [Clostridiales bacterium]|jgi:carbamoyl-phosphate synthase small subunit|nr:carbamoyl phosphate synthase small subunit [Clostridiales bacterium]
MSKAYLILADGHIFEGESFGASEEVTGEIVFTTGMTGYLETLTDKSYAGQIIAQTFPLIGNYGVIPEDFESGKIHARGYIVREWCRAPSNFRSEGALDSFLKTQGIVGLSGIDTRALTKIIRTQGVMNGRIARSVSGIDYNEINSYKIENAVSAVSCKAPYTHAALASPSADGYKVALMDFGLKENIIRELVKRGCAVTVFPHSASEEAVLACGPDGVMLSNGPGDPADNPGIIAEIGKLFESNTPIFGICLGHQLMALASGFKTRKMKFGHRGANQPVKDLGTGRVYITSQNHGYEVVRESVNRSIARELFINVNDSTNEGLEYISGGAARAFSAQFHPEAHGGPLDTGFLFDRFVSLMKGGQQCPWIHP